jgi:hypothetical protein
LSSFSGKNIDEGLVWLTTHHSVQAGSVSAQSGCYSSNPDDLAQNYLINPRVA